MNDDRDIINSTSYDHPHHHDHLVHLFLMVYNNGVVLYGGSGGET
jgi:hypothetical protein